jgi:hypothetical protein
MSFISFSPSSLNVFGLVCARAIARAGFQNGPPPRILRIAPLADLRRQAVDGEFRAKRPTSSPTKTRPFPRRTATRPIRAVPPLPDKPSIAVLPFQNMMLCDGNTYNYGYIGSRATWRFSRNVLSYCPSPRPRSQAATSMRALHTVGFDDGPGQAACPVLWSGISGLGHNAKYSVRADIFRSSTENGHPRQAFAFSKF